MNRKFRLRFTSLLLCVAMFCFAVGVALAQDYPQKPIRFIVQFTAGGSSDLTARIIAEKLKEVLGQPVLVENRPGADGRIGTEVVARAAPDGYTLLMATNGPISIAPSMFIKLPYDPVKDFEPITLGALSLNLLLVHPSVPAKSVEELVKLAKSKPGKLNYGSTGLGQPGHLSAELFKKIADIDIMHVPYKGSGELITALLGGHVEIAFGSVAAALQHVNAGSLRALAITSAKRSALAPDIPTLVESGFPGVIASTWNGVFAPAGTRRAIITKLNTEIVKILKMPDVFARLQKSGLEPIPSTPEELAAYLKEDILISGNVLRSAGIQPQ